MKNYIIIRTYEIVLKWEGVPFDTIETARPSVFGTYATLEEAKNKLKLLKSIDPESNYYICEILRAE